MYIALLALPTKPTDQVMILNFMHLTQVTFLVHSPTGGLNSELWELFLAITSDAILNITAVAACQSKKNNKSEVEAYGYCGLEYIQLIYMDAQKPAILQGEILLRIENTYCQKMISQERNEGEMKHIVYNKLVRDHIPEIVAASGRQCDIRILSEGEYLAMLKIILHEEIAEYEESGEVEELSDILEVLYALAKAGGNTPEELEAMRARKANERGGFAERILMLSVDDSD